jgi:hypothetical protein
MWEGITGNRKTCPFWMVRRQRSGIKNEKLLGGVANSLKDMGINI